MTNTKKKIVATTAAMAAVTAGAISVNANTAHADTVDPTQASQTNSQTSQTKNAQQQAQDKFIQAGQEKNQAQTAMDQAASQADTTQTAFNQASQAQSSAAQQATNTSNQVSQASQAVSQAQTALDHAQNNAAQATSDNIQAASQAVDDAQAAVNTASDTASQASQAVSQAQTTLNQAQQTAKNAQATVDNDQKTVNTATNSMDVTSAKKALDDANTALNTAKTNQTNAHQAVTDAQNDVNTKQKAVDQAKSTASQAATNETSAKTKLDDTNANVTNKQNAVSQAQTALNNASSQTSTGSVTDPASWGLSVTATQDAKNAAAEAKSAGSANYDQKERMLNGLTVTYTPSSHDRSVTLTNTSIMYAIHDVLNSMTTDNWQLNIQVQEFLAAMLNGIHQALGIDNTVIPNEALMRDASTFANDPKYKNFAWGKGVDHTNLTNKAATLFNGSVNLSYGAETNPHQGFAKDGYNYDTQTGHNLDLSNLKSLFATTILEGIKALGGPDWSHFSQQNNIASDLILGTNNLNAGAKTYFGMAFKNTTNQGGMYAGFYETANDAQGFDPDIASATTYGVNAAKPSDNTALQTALNNAKAALATAQSEQRQTQSAYDTAHQAAQQAATQLNDAQSALTSAQTKLTTAQTAAQSSDRAVDAAQQVVNQATQAYNDANADIATKQQKLQAAKDQLAKDLVARDNANAQVSQATTALNDAKNALTSANDDLQAKQDALTKAKQHLSDLQNAQANLTKAQAALKAAQENLTLAKQQASAAQDKLEDANTKLASAKAANDKAQATLKSAQDLYQQKLNAYNTAKANLISDAKQYGNNVKLDTDHITITEGESVPSPKLNNTFIHNRENSEVESMFTELATISGGDLPEGTTIAWTNPTKVNADAAHAGEYVEDVTITFPDKSTVTKQIKLTVNYNPSLHQRQTNLPNGAHVVNNQVVDQFGNVIPGYQVVNGQIVATPTTTTTDLVTPQAGNHGDVTMTREQYKARQLPQTGNGNNAGLLGLGLIGMFGALGLAKRRRHN